MDGNLVYSGNFVNNPYIWNSLLFGATQGCVTCPAIPTFNGKLDDVRISNIARSTNDIGSYFNSNQPFQSDVNTIGLFNLDFVNSNTVSNQLGGIANVFGTPTMTSGKFGQCINFDGVDDYIRWTQSIPVNNLSVEFWFKSNDVNGMMLMLEYAYNSGISIGGNTITNTMTWSTGATGNSITVDPTQQPFIWVTDGNCTDTIWFDSQSATIYDTITVFDTLYTTVTDTLIIHSTVGSPGSTSQNTILMYPNPANDFLIIDNGNYTIMNGYNISITSSNGQQVYFNPINQQILNVDLSTWNGNGLYHVYIIDNLGNIIEHRKIILQ